MYVSVKFKKEELGGYSGRAYTYFTTLPLEIGDKVIVPSPNGDSKGLVVDIITETPDFACKEITEYDMGKEEENTDD